MKFTEFERWCENRASDGCWGLREAITCIGILKEIRQYFFWKREKIWKEEYEKAVVEQIIKPLDEKRSFRYK